MTEEEIEEEIRIRFRNVEKDFYLSDAYFGEPFIDRLIREIRDVLSGDE